MGSGKTTIAKLLHPNLKRTVLIGGDEIKWFISDFRRNKRDNDIIHRVLLKMCDEYLKNGINILLVQGFYSKERAKQYLKIAKKYKCKIRFYHLEAPRKVLLERVNKKPPSAGANKPIPKTDSSVSGPFPPKPTFTTNSAPPKSILSMPTTCESCVITSSRRMPAGRVG